MGKIFYNHVLFSSLPRMLGKKQSQMVSECNFYSYYAIAGYMRKKELRLDTLLTVCNTYRIEPTTFFSETDKPDTMCVEQLIVPEEKWTPVVMNMEEVRPLIARYKIPKTSQLATYLNEHDIPVEKAFSHTIELNKENAQETHTEPSAKRETDHVWVYNHQLFESMPNLTGIGRKELGVNAGFSENTFYNAMRDKDITLRMLVAMCNLAHVHIAHFFKHPGLCFFPEEIVTPPDKWNEIEFHPERMKLLYAPGAQNGIALENVLAALKFTEPRFYRNADPQRSKLHAVKYAEFCTKMKLHPMFIFETSTAYSTRSANAILYSKIERLNEEINILEKENKALKERLWKAGLLGTNE